MVKRNGLQFPQMTADSVQADSKQGMELLFGWARYRGWVLDEVHFRMAKKYGVATDGVIIRLPMPTAARKREVRVK